MVLGGKALCICMLSFVFFFLFFFVLFFSSSAMIAVELPKMKLRRDLHKQWNL